MISISLSVLKMPVHQIYKYPVERIDIKYDPLNLVFPYTLIDYECEKTVQIAINRLSDADLTAIVGSYRAAANKLKPDWWNYY